MFNWYRNSSLCIIHLGNTTYSDTRPPPPHAYQSDPWFYRGWTLQELLAPRTIKFYDREWRPITKESNDKTIDANANSKKTFLGKISDWTHIPLADIVNFEPGVKHCREQLRWAAQRATTRLEDKAYCLMGIFNVNMSIAYGEGEKAFHWLQAEIMEESSDRSLPLWIGEPSHKSSMFAREPRCFLFQYDVI